MQTNDRQADYRNRVPAGTIAAFGAGTAVSLAGAIVSGVRGKSRAVKMLGAVCGAGALACAAGTAWSAAAYRAFAWDGERALMREVVEGTAEYITLPAGGRGLDVGCGSGALTIACAKRNPRATMLGIDRWEHTPFSRELCERNAGAEGVVNAAFARGDAAALDFPDESFDAVTSNYVYGRLMGTDRQALLREALRVLKKGGVFAIHDLMGRRYGDMAVFAEELRSMGYARVELIDTDDGLFMSRGEARRLFLTGSKLLVGEK